ncbi:hypothetical protein K432DRAFT_353801 [Lepidopterella palustris CBS 459.81]|uniref:S-adenosyl-L-methionine-dependent methyltransferase n=1 Tax=Lepidopterella palustris CBS 459.81 TaxID=1314670 RepID=A0A8E2E9M8_9PEZI|nr:hypothetical protein K432DRAFT_353801 [Lepidopterella palustris CBS 459.81]
MWMNMGYWKETSDFPTACRALLVEVLQTAEVFMPHHGAAPDIVKFVDLGFGCGDQTIFLEQELKRVFLNSELLLPPFVHYVGITLDRTQFRFALSRTKALGILPPYDDPSTPYVQLFCADAANPDSWDGELKRAMTPFVSPHPDIPSALLDAGQYDQYAGNAQQKTWVLALDTLYHFSPSRWPIINYASRTLNASLMAFDLVIADNVSIFRRLLLRIICLLTGSPYANFITVARYREMLVQAGYQEADIDIKDVSRHVFAPLARFLGDQERRLRVIGLGIGGFRVAMWMFRWWGETGVVRGVIVVARK